MTVAMRIGLGLVVAVVAGVLDGGTARLLMRGVALASEQVPAFSVEATLGIMLIFSITAVPLGVTAKLTSRRGARFAAVALGTLRLGFFTTTIGVQEVTNANCLTTLHRLGLGACVVGLAAVVLIQPWVVLRLVRAGRGGPRRACFFLTTRRRSRGDRGSAQPAPRYPSRELADGLAGTSASAHRPTRSAG